LTGPRPAEDVDPARRRNIMTKLALGGVCAAIGFASFACGSGEATGSSGGGSSGSSGGSGGSGTTGGGSSSYICDFTASTGELCTGCTGVQECDAFSGADLSQELSAIEYVCSLEVAPSNPPACPSRTNRIGCCSYPYVPGINVTEKSCFYGSDSGLAADLPTQCNAEIFEGVWTPN
jgi:hypothetical protein